MGTKKRRTAKDSFRDVTVVVAIYKAGKFIEAKIENLRNQTIFNNINIALLNCQNLEGEREKYQEFLDKHHNVIEIFYEDHIRLYPTWNDGIKSTDSEFICNANVDDMWHPEYLERCVRFLRHNKSYSCVSTGIVLTYTPNQVNYEKWQWQHKFPIGTYPQTTAGPCPVWRRSLHDKYGYFGNYRTIGDARMWEKWHAGGEKFGYLKQDLVLYYASGVSLERRVDLDKQKSYRELDLEEEAGITEANNGITQTTNQAKAKTDKIIGHKKTFFD